MARRFMVCGLVVCGLVMAVCSPVVRGDDKHQHALPPAPTNAGLEKMKSLVGTWVMADESGKPTEQVVSIVKTTAGGSAVHETIFPGQPMEMVSVYTAEGDNLLMTHYCVLGNQPHMNGDYKSANDQIKFEFAGGSNLDVKKDKHMHGSTVTFHGDDLIELEGEAWEGGKPSAAHCGCMKLVRKK